MTDIIFENQLIRIEIEQSEIPWLKIFTQKEIKEFSLCDHQTKMQIWHALDVIEKEMLTYFKPEKINIASFGNYMPHVHFHIMARFKEDSFFPEPMWGKKQRDAELDLPDVTSCYKNISALLNSVSCLK
ncbi:MAG: HIT family protein [Psychrobium sp.]